MKLGFVIIAKLSKGFLQSFFIGAAKRFTNLLSTPSNLLGVLNDNSPLILLAIGQMIVILTKCIDLSVAANLALTGMVVAMINVVAPNMPVFVIIIVAVALGTLMGIFNGL